ncbi:MAG: hypothetical protein AAGJ18_00875 [Bacteroidota bacterium]
MLNKMQPSASRKNDQPSTKQEFMPLWMLNTFGFVIIEDWDNF